MKKILLTVCTSLFVFLFASANNADLFTYDVEAVDQELAQLQSLEDYVCVNPGITLTDMQSENNGLLAGMNLNTNTGGFPFLSGEPPLGIPSFLWGCILSWVGILVVYLVTDNDKDETKKALMGCLVNAGAIIIWEIFWVVVWGNALFAF